MSGVPAMYCGRCGTLREIKDWRERSGDLIVAVEPCGHEVRRPAGIEWSIRQAAA